MANPFLIVVTVILSLAIIAGCIYILVYFQHPEDKNVAWGPKIVVVLGLTLACFSVLMLPLDVGNGRDGGFPMDVLWMVVYIVMAAFAVVIIPFAMFYYEGDEYDETGKADSQLVYALKGTFITFIVFAVVTVVMYLFLGIAEIPVIQLQGAFVTTQNRTVPYDRINMTLFNYTQDTYSQQANVTANCTTTGNPNAELPYNIDNSTGWCIPLQNFTYNTTVNETFFNATSGQNENRTVIVNVTELINATCLYYDPCLIPQDKALFQGQIDRNKTHAKFRVSIVLYIITMVVFFGWILFIIFGGIGMVAFPLDCIAAWQRRPVRITLEKYVTRKKEIGDQATKLIAKGKAIQEKQRKKSKETKRDRRNYNRFRQAVFMLEDDYERLQQCYKRQGGKVILYFLTFLLGCFSVGLTIIWLLHIILFVFTQPYPIDPFLNTMVMKMDDAWGFLGTIAYGVFSFYLLLCCIKGNFKFGMRVFFLFPIHPMRVGGTLMNAFLFNTGLIIICAFSVTQFCATAFSDYTSETAINSMFALSVKNIMGLKYIFIGYVYALFIMVFLTGIYFILKPKDKPAIDDIVI